MLISVSETKVASDVNAAGSTTLRNPQHLDHHISNRIQS